MSAAEASESVYMRERVNGREPPGKWLSFVFSFIVEIFISTLNKTLYKKKYYELVYFQDSGENYITVYRNINHVSHFLWHLSGVCLKMTNWPK